MTVALIMKTTAVAGFNHNNNYPYEVAKTIRKELAKQDSGSEVLA